MADKKITVTIFYPQIVIERKEVEITEEQLEDFENSGVYDQAAFIWNELTELEQNHTHGEKWLTDAVDDNHSRIERTSSKPVDHD